MDENETKTQTAEVATENQSEPAPDVQAGVDELISDAPDVEPEPEPEPEPKAEDGEPTREAAKKRAEKHERKAAEKADKDGDILKPLKKETPKKFKIGEKEYSLEDIQKDAGLIEQLAITHGKHTTLSSKHQELLEQSRKLQAKPAETAAGPKITPEMYAREFSPHLAESVKGGFIEPEFQEMFPNLGAQLMFFRTRFEKLWDHVDKFTARSHQTEATQGKEQAERALHGHLDELASGDPEHYKALADADTRKDFLAYMDEINPQVPGGKLTPEFLGKMWFSFVSEAVVEREKRRREELDTAKKRHWLASEVGSTRSTQAAKPSSMEADVNDLITD
jgi:hypothetical protein